MDGPLRICLLGASTDTGNQGVSALCLATLRGVLERAPDAQVTVFDHGFGTGPVDATLDGRPRRWRRCGLRHSKRIYLRESMFRVGLAAALGGANPAADALREADAVLDITGGDSFTDLYGRARFRSGSTAKRLALRLSGGLVLLPQTFGPFREARTRSEAGAIVRAATAAWARDEASFAVLRELAGPSFDPARHHAGVDVAFRLAAAEPATLPAPIAAWLAPGRDRPVAGFNVSGLVHNDPAAARRDYGLSCDYREVVRTVVRTLAEDGARVLLVPHVHTPTGHFESDRDACEAVRAAMPAELRDAVAVVPDLGAAEAKWVIARTDWSCATRMHAAIAALSSGVPGAALAYSVKTRGVFATCGQEEHVADLRSATTEAAIASVVASWRARETARESLAARLPATLAAADRQMDEVVAVCRRLAAARRPRGAAAPA
jgi:colanic acid/amylovoran biosynthesis protein WcaK/AmsJ